MFTRFGFHLTTEHAIFEIVFDRRSPTQNPVEDASSSKNESVSSEMSVLDMLMIDNQMSNVMTGRKDDLMSALFRKR